jgi:hypothetical protein
MFGLLLLVVVFLFQFEEKTTTQLGIVQYKLYDDIVLLVYVLMVSNCNYPDTCTKKY